MPSSDSYKTSDTQTARIVAETGENSASAARVRPRHSTPPQAHLAIAGLFAGIGGIELGMQRAGHEAKLLCENDERAQAVLREQFPDVRLTADVRELKALPRGTQLLTAGFPCQDLSQAGMTRGIGGDRSGLVGEVFRLLTRRKTEWVLIENVPFMLQLGRGKAMDMIVSTLEDMGYRWAYRIVDSRAFGLPQRRRRVYLLASQSHDPREVLLSEDAGSPQPSNRGVGEVACGFYWTEGIRGLGWAVDSVPTLKGGSTVGIPSPPAIVMPNGEVIKPDLRDAERMQGFRQDWTKPAERAGRSGFRWKLVGNAVTVPVAKWIGTRLASPRSYDASADYELPDGRPWPTAAWNVGHGRFVADLSEWPVHKKAASLAEFLRREGTPLSVRATAGFLERTSRSTLRFPEGFLPTLRSHLKRMQSS